VRALFISTFEFELSAENRHLCFFQLQEQKRALTESALSGEAMSKVATLGRDELLALFRRGDHEEDEED
jgi:hypothetical protein